MLKHPKRRRTAAPDIDGRSGQHHQAPRQGWPAARRARGVTVRADPAGQSEDWLSGRGDMLIAALGDRVPLAIQLSVLAHADIGRLQDLGRHRRLGSVRRAWGTEMARLAGDIARHAGTPDALAGLQRDVLIPLELELLAGRAAFPAAADAVGYLRARLALPGTSRP
jgi:hypothetical protein